MTNNLMTANEESWLSLAVVGKVQVASDIWMFTLAPVTGADDALLPQFTAGAHLTVITPAGIRRNYSLCCGPEDRRRYQIAVKREANGRGGSRSMVDDVGVGAHLMVSTPRNNFMLDRRAKSFLFVAGDWHHADPVDDAAPQSRRHRAVPFVLLHPRRCQHGVRE